MSYVNDTSIWGMMNSGRERIQGLLGYYKTKSHNKIVCMEVVNNEDDFDEISYMYMSEKPDKTRYTGIFHMDEIVSDLSEELFLEMSGSKYKELRETRNKLSKITVARPLTRDNYLKVLEMIERWRYSQNGGMKYGWQEHAGIDKALINRYIHHDGEWCDRVIMTTFWIDEECVGYSCIEVHPSTQEDNIPCYSYLTRKTLNRERNLTEYIDWYTFKQVYELNRESREYRFLINWGASSGGVHWYKTHKWDLYSLTTRWFYKYKRKNRDDRN